MKNAKKLILLALCAVLLVGASVMGTLAYLTSQTETITNTMTVGKVEISLTENQMETDGLTQSSTVVDVTNNPLTNAYKLIPGHTYDKNPTVTVKEGSEPCYVFVKVENGIVTLEDSGNTIAAQIAANGWAELAGVDNVFYKKIETVTATDTQHPVFTTFKIAGNANELSAWNNSVTIQITAYAIQADGFDTAAAAWAASGFGTP